MKVLSLLLLLFSLLPCLADPRPYVLYAQFQQETPVKLNDGSEWVMDAGDCFPIYMFKEHQTKLVLQLGSATFTTEATRLRVLKESETPRALASYRHTLENYLKAKAENWKKQATQTPDAPPSPSAIPLR